MQQYPGPFSKKKWTKEERDQIKSFTKAKLRKLLDRDPRWEFVHDEGGRVVYRNVELSAPWDYVAIHPSKQEYRNPSLLLWQIDHICWTGKVLRAWKALK